MPPLINSFRFPKLGALSLAPMTLNHAAGTELGYELYLNETMFGAGHPFFTSGLANGGDVRFYDIDGTTQLPIELMSFTQGASRKLAMMTRLPRAYAQGALIGYAAIDTREASQPPATDPLVGSRLVWQDETFVMHNWLLAQSGGAVDATGLRSISLLNTPALASVSGAPGGQPAVSFASGSASNDGIQTNAFALPTARSLRTFHKTSSANDSNRPIFGRSQFGAGAGDMGMRRNGGNGLELILNFATTAGLYTVPNPPLGQYVHYAVSVDKDAIAAAPATAKPLISIDGVDQAVTIATQPVGAVSNPSNILLFCHDFNGTLGEQGLARFRPAALSSAWLAAEYANLSAAAAFASVGAFI